MTALALSWSGGKDSALALWSLRAASVEPLALVTTINEAEDRVGMHRVPAALVRGQAAAAGLPLVEIPLPPNCPNAVYEEGWASALRGDALAAVDTIAFGDLFLEDIRAYREKQLRILQRKPSFPLWDRDTSDLARLFVASGFQAVVVSVDPAQLDPGFCGRDYDTHLLADLPAGVDPCGENGEFHTFVHAGPVFKDAVEYEVGEPFEHDGFVFCDVQSTARQPG
jgi:uncharacterized protein (TIGR00290 family)